MLGLGISLLDEALQGPFVVVAPPTGLSAADLALTSPTGAIPIAFTVSMGADIFEGFYLNGEFSADGLTDADGTYTTPTQTFRHQLTPPEHTSGTVDLTGEFTDPSGQYWLHCWWERQDGTLGAIGTAIHDTVTSASLAFTDQTGVATSTPITSNTATLTGAGTNATVVVGSGQYSLNGGAFTAAGTFTMALGDTLALKQTSSASNATETDVSVTINGVGQTWRVTTIPAAGVASLAYHASGSNATGTSYTLAGVSFAAGNRIAAVRTSSGASSVTIGGNACTKVASGAGGMEIWIDTTSRAAATADVVVNTSSSGYHGVFALTGQNVLNPGTPTDTTTKLNASSGDPKLYGDTLVVPANGIGLCFARGGGSSGITWNNGTLIAGLLNSTLGEYLSIASFAPGTVTPSFNSGTTNSANGSGCAWDHT